jgi:hypothetical protein
MGGKNATMGCFCQYLMWFLVCDVRPYMRLTGNSSRFIVDFFEQQEP